jgi:stage II sporulation protein D
MSRRTAILAIVVAACTSAPPAPEPTPASIPTAPRRDPDTPPTVPTPARGRSVPRTTGRRESAEPSVRDAGDATIRVLLSSSARTEPTVGSPGGLLFTDRDGNMLARADRDEVWTVEREGRRVRAVRANGRGTPLVDGPMFARALGGALLNVGGRPYRGDVAFHGTDTSVAVVNVVKIDDYLRGVVPGEIGTTNLADSAAVQAQAVTARSYAYVHLEPGRMYDVTGGVLDLVYGGVAVETAVASEAVESTRTLVLKYAGRVVNAPYHSTCGGETAAASELWRSDDEPYLRSVSDQIPGTSRYYCDIAPRFRWTRTLDRSTLNAALARYLASYAKVRDGVPGVARAIAVTSRTTSGRVGTVAITTDRGMYTVRGNDVRYVLRAPGSEILNSTQFSLESTPAVDGTIAKLVIRGQGYGHGVGMCQWGAIGRARAGQDFLTILTTYYPGTTVGAAQ